VCPSLLAALALAVGAPVPKDPPKSAPSVVGEWVAERSTFAGSDRPLPREPVRYVFAPDGTWALYRGDRKLPGEGRTYAAGPGESPPAIDLFYDEVDADRDPPARRQVVRGIYKVDGDTLTLCLATAGGDRPKTFESAAGLPSTRWVFKRVKKD
jgi:uncharacterized protein (TIGR03067 family)